jgi:hypothetical protein
MNGFDRTPEGEEIIALLKRAAPPRPDSRAAAQRVMQRVRAPERKGWMGYLVSASALAAAAAVALIVLFPPAVDAPGSAPAPAPALASGADAVDDGISVHVRSVTPLPSGDAVELLLDAGLARGLRAGDELRFKGTVIRIAAVGIFTARAIVDAGKAPARGERLTSKLTEAMRREQRFEFIGGDPGALYDFGAVLEPLPRHEAKLRGFSDGRALVVIETISAILRDRGVETSLAGAVGLQKGDVILSCNGLPAGDLPQFTSALELSRRGGQLKLRVLRGSSELELIKR